MLPSSGYFQSINCPFYDSGLCDRSYCHYRHVKKDASNSSKEVGSSETSSSSLLGGGDNHDILQQLVSEAVKKALRDTELSTSGEGDVGSSSSSGGTEEVSSKLVEKVIEGLKPLVAISPPPLPAAAATGLIPSYKPTPISELRKRHIPVPYTPKDTKTILVKRQLGNDGGSYMSRVKPASTKRREEYVPATSGKAIDSEKSCYKPYGLPSYGEVHYSPAISTVTSEILYTPSDKSSLTAKSSDYVPTGFSDVLLPNAFYEPTNRGDGPMQEPEYQPDLGSSSSRLVSYIPSKLESSKGDSDSEKNDNVAIPEDSLLTSSQFLDCHGDSDGGKTVNDDQSEQFSSVKSFATNFKAKVNLEDLSETQSGALKGSGSVSNPASCVQLKSRSESKERDRSKFSSKRYPQQKDGKDHQSQREHKNGKGHSVSEDQKGARIVKETKHQKASSDQKNSKSSKDTKNLKQSKDAHASKNKKPSKDESKKQVDCQKLVKDGHASKDQKNSKGKAHEKEVGVHKSSKDSKDSKDLHRRKSVEEHGAKSKRPHPYSSSEEISCKRKDRPGDLNSKNESKNKPESSHHKHSKEGKISVDRHRSSQVKHSVKVHSTYKTKNRSEISVGKNKLSTKKVKSTSSHLSNSKKLEVTKSLSETSISDVKKKPHVMDSFEEMEALIQERLQESDYSDDLSMEDSDTDEDTRTEECLRIFNSYKPEIPKENEGVHKKTKVGEKEPEAADSCPPAKKRFAHEGAALLPKKPTVPRKVFDPAKAMVHRLVKAKVHQVEYNPTKAKEQMESDVQLTKPKDHPTEIPLLQPKTLAGKRRIAHVPNVSKLLDAKEKLLNVVQGIKPEPTKSQTVSKGSSRVAHVPPKEVTCRPLISSLEGTKIPTNIRQRYCNLMFDELLKKIESVQDCCRLALEEEESCYSRSSSRNVYVNLAIIAIQRLRNLVTPHGKDDSSGGSRLTVSHENVIGGKSKAQGLWSIIPPKKAPAVLDESLAYQLLMEKYVMTEEELVNNGFPRACPNEKGKALMIETAFRSKTKSKNFFERVCDRCGKEYVVNEKGLGNPEDQCIFHWGRAFKRRGIGELETRYSCCQGEARTDGCEMWNCHVCDMFDPNNLRGFVQTLEKSDGDHCKIYALDCEMCYTTDGLDLARITVINYDGETVYDTLVKPEKMVLDYVTRFSGIDEEAMKGVTKTLLDVQATLLSMFDKKTILVGHSLDSDMKAMKLIHDTVVDTSLMFPHRRGPPFKRALKTLCAEYLKKLIQTGEEGHDSAEDALACIDLLKWKLMEDLKTK